MKQVQDYDPKEDYSQQERERERASCKEELRADREREVLARARHDGYRVMKRGYRKGVDQYWLMFGAPLTLASLENALIGLEGIGITK
jgi:hypothetical protein